jgi:hypothetical protein
VNRDLSEWNNPALGPGPIALGIVAENLGDQGKPLIAAATSACPDGIVFGLECLPYFLKHHSREWLICRDVAETQRQILQALCPEMLPLGQIIHRSLIQHLHWVDLRLLDRQVGYARSNQRTNCGPGCK